MSRRSALRDLADWLIYILAIIALLCWLSYRNTHATAAKPQETNDAQPQRHYSVSRPI